MARIPIVRTTVGKLGHRLASIADQAQAYYHTPEHRRWAADVMKRAQGRCEKCGVTGKRLFAHHIVEVRDGGKWTQENGQALCGSCHTVVTLINKAKRWSR